jgi:hypothetical protein
MVALATPTTQASRLEYSDELLTQKELDPDFVAFNSENRRYHFPFRFYMPFRGIFAQKDPLVLSSSLEAWRKFKDGNRLHPYKAMAASPTINVDPFGLLASTGESPTCQSTPTFCHVEVRCYTAPSTIAAATAAGVLGGPGSQDAVMRQNWQHCYIRLTKCDGTSQCISAGPSNPISGTLFQTWGTLVNNPGWAPCAGGILIWSTAENCNAPSTICDCISSTESKISGKYKYPPFGDSAKYQGVNSNTYIGLLLRTCASLDEYRKAVAALPGGNVERGGGALGFTISPGPGDFAPGTPPDFDPTRPPGMPSGGHAP